MRNIRMGNITHILGMNARDQLYTSLNSIQAKRFGFSKLRTKAFLKKHGILVPELYTTLTSQEEVRTFRWSSIPGGFAIKPSNGSAGKGVLVIKRRYKQKYMWEDIEGKLYSAGDLRFHAYNILDGQYSTWGTLPNVLIEERIPVHPDLEPFVEVGTPDVRVIVFNNIPIMAMTRLPNKQSGGRANLEQGAIALGIDMGTGKTTYGISGKHDVLRTFPHTRTSTQGIRIPFWEEALRTAVRAANATGLRYMGADLFLHPGKGPMVAEVNAYPGLSIQLANRAGLRKRLQRLEDIQARNVNHAVKIGQSLFAENYSVEHEGDMTIIGTKEQVEIYGEHDQVVKGTALINTAREWSAIAYDTAQTLGLADTNDVLWTQYIEGAGKEIVVEVKFKLHDKIRTTTMVVSKRLQTGKYIMHIGRKDLAGYLVGLDRSSL